MITLDPTTFVVQLGLFLVLWFVLKRLWFAPAQRLIHERRTRSEGAVREAQAIQAEAERLRADHAAALEQVRAEAQRETQEIVRAAETEQKRLIAEARDDAQRTLHEARSRIADEVVAARRGLRAEAEQITREVVRKVLGRPV